MPHAGVQDPVGRTPIWKVVGASLVGTTMEWYGFFLYGAAAGSGSPYAGVR